MSIFSILNWQLQRYEVANDYWKHLDDISEYVGGRRRIIKSYTSCNKNQEPILYRGQISYLPHDERKSFGRVYVEDLSQEIAFSPIDFRLKECNIGDSLPDFYLSFNYIGPYADPRRHFDS